MLPYFPFGQQFNHRMGTAPLPESDHLVEVDDAYVPEIALKRQLLADLPAYYYQTLPGYELAQWEVLKTVLTHLVRFAPDRFALRQTGNQWHWHNRLLHEETSFVFGDSSTLPVDPLDWVGRQVQEDLILIAGDSPKLVAGQLCFGNDWSLDEKLGLPFSQVHAPILPIVEPMMQATHKLIERLPIGKPLWRASWSVKVTDQLDMTSRHKPALLQLLADRIPTLTPETIGEALFIRIERQTLIRLPETGIILFCIHTYQNQLAHEATDRDRASRMASVFSTTPSAMLDYKGMSGFVPVLLKYLQNKLDN